MSNLPEIQKRDIWEHASNLVEPLPDSFQQVEAFRAFICARVGVATGLEKLLERALELSVGLPAISKELQKNLDDEQGRIDGEIHPERAHARSREVFRQALGIADETRNSIDAEFQEALAGGSLFHLLGMIYYLEESIPKEFIVILGLVRKFYGEDDSRDFYLLDHIKHDAGQHAPDLRKALSSEMQSDDETDFLEGIKIMQRIKERFYAQFV